MKVAHLLGSRGPWWRQVCRDLDCLGGRSQGPIRVLFQTSCSWLSEGLFGQSFSVAPPTQARRGIPCLGSYCVDQGVRHLEGHPGRGPTLLFSTAVTERGPRVGSCSVAQRVSV